MLIQDKDIDPNAELAKRRWEFQKELTPISQAAVCFGRFNPGTKFEITRVTAWSRTGNANSKIDVRISGVSALAAVVTPAQGVANAPVVCPLGAATKAGSANDTIDIYVTTDAGSVIDDLLVVVEYRARVYRRSP